MTKIANKEFGDNGWASQHNRGRIGGRSKSLNKDSRNLALKLFHEKEHSIDQICRIIGVSRATLYKYVNAAKSAAGSM